MRTQWGCWQYKTHYAQTYADDRHKNKPKRIKFNKIVEKFVTEKVQFEVVIINSFKVGCVKCPRGLNTLRNTFFNTSYNLTVFILV